MDDDKREKAIERLGDTVGKTLYVAGLGLIHPVLGTWAATAFMWKTIGRVRDDICDALGIFQDEKKP